MVRRKKTSAALRYVHRRLSAGQPERSGGSGCFLGPWPAFEESKYVLAYALVAEGTVKHTGP
jgi:hypothetical protein